MNAFIDYPLTVMNSLKNEIKSMAISASEYAEDPARNFKRKRKIGFVDLITFLIVIGNSNTEIELNRYFDYNVDAIPRSSAFIQQRSKLKLYALRYLLKAFNDKFPLTLYRNKYNLIAVDGCEFNIFRNAGDPETYYEPSGKTTLGYNMIHTIPLFDVISKRYLDIEFQPGRLKNEFQAYCNLVDRYENDVQPIFIADRGFASYNTFAHTIEAKHKFLMRAKDLNIKRYLNLSELPDTMDQIVTLILTHSQNKKKRLQPHKSDQYRKICKKVSFDFIDDNRTEYELSFRVVRFDLGNGNFENIVTNLSEDEFSAEDLKDIYWLRWKIETSFRDLKHTIGTENFHSKSVKFVSQEILARMILFNFSTIIISHSVIKKYGKKHVHQVNFSMAMKLCIDYLSSDGKIDSLKILINKYTLPVREGRKYLRRHRFRPPVSFCFKFF